MEAGLKRGFAHFLRTMLIGIALGVLLFVCYLALAALGL